MNPIKGFTLQFFVACGDVQHQANCKLFAALLFFRCRLSQRGGLGKDFTLAFDNIFISV